MEADPDDSSRRLKISPNSPSPSNSFSGLPPTLPDFFSRQDDPFSLSPFFSIAAVLEEEQAKFAAVPPSAATAVGYDSFGSCTQSNQMSKPDSSGSGSGSRSSGDSPGSIDLQLVLNSVPSRAVSDFDEEEEGEDDDIELDDLHTIPDDLRISTST